MKRLFIAVLMIFSITTAFAQIVNKAEYFFDNDPGQGNGSPITISTPGVSVSFPAQIPVNLSPGFHWLGIRVKDSDGKWSLFQRKDFYVSQPSFDLPIVTKAEYFFDNDPGVGGGTPLTFQTPGFSVSQTFPITVPASMTAGTHYLAIRVKDQAGHWSLFQRDTIVVGASAATISCPANIITTAASGQCSAIVNNIDPTVSPEGSSYTYTLTGATTGSGTGTASGKTFNAGVTTVTYALSSSPSTSCSFTVTVNTNIVPSVIINANNESICTGGTIVFTATPTNGGSTPHYQWKQNGVNAGTDSVIFQTNQLNNGDVISVVMTSSIGCATPASATSNSIAVTVTPPYITPTINITASSTSICPGTPVTFIAQSTNGGMPWYSWQLNNNWLYGPNSDTLILSTLANGDKIRCVMTSSLACVTDVTTISNEITMSVGNLPASVSIVASDSSICPGQLVTFTATPVNGGSNPQYEWTVNNNAVNVVNSATYQSSTLHTGDVVRVTMQPSGGCGGDNFVYSNSITMSAGSSVVPSVTIGASATNICTGTSVTFTASPVNQGDNPIYQWKLNGYNIPGANGTTYQTSSLADGDQVKFAMVSSLSCADPSDVVSNMITMTVGSGVTPSVSINASAIDICAGNSVTFTATPTNGGATPSYQWKLNGNNVGTNSATYQSSSLNNADTIRVVMTTSLSCASPNYATSNYISMDVTQPVSPSVSIVASSTSICSGQSVSFTATPANGGASPVYQWKLNGAIVGTNSNTFQSSALSNNDVVSVSMTSSLPCVTASVVNSNSISIAVSQQITYYADKDGDGYGDATDSVVTCGLRAGFVTNKSDCNDNNASIHPGAIEICGNGIDDNCNGQIDENCTQNLPTLATRNYPVKEGDAGLTTVNIDVSLDIPAPLPVTLKYKTINEDAIAGTDYQSASGTLLIPAGKTSGTLQVKIIGDVLRESNERFKINFSDPINVLLPADPNSHVMIIDDDKGKPNSASPGKDAAAEVSSFKIPTVVKRNTVWMIPQIGNYENEVMILNVQGQVVNRFINYKNQSPVGNIASGLYFYRIQLKESNGQIKYYTGRLLITE